jgi:hypothetical protein
VPLRASAIVFSDETFAAASYGLIKWSAPTSDRDEAGGGAPGQL